MGLGLFGGSTGLIQYLAAEGADITVTDLRTETVLQESVNYLQNLDITYHLGEHHENDFSEIDYLFISPAVSWDSPYLDLAKKNNIPISTEMNLFLSRVPCDTVMGITGTNGKTTVTALIGEMLKKQGRKTWVGGNIGGSLLASLPQMQQGDAVILELSSFQLFYMEESQGEKISTAVVTNLTGNHLDWHKTMKHYIDAKKNILRWQRPSALCILNGDDTEVKSWSNVARGRPKYFSLSARSDGAYVAQESLAMAIDDDIQTILPESRLKLPGSHNVANALAAMLAARDAGANIEAIQDTLRTFQGVQHRLEFVAEKDGVRYINDSIATNPESSIVAIRAFNAPMILLLGGSDKGIPFDRLAVEILNQSVKVIILYGKTAGKIETAIQNAGKDVSSRVPTLINEPSFDDAFHTARARAASGDIVLLSPACASFDQFPNFAKRGDRFKQLVEE